jgi:hypothetical protein
MIGITDALEREDRGRIDEENLIGPRLPLTPCAVFADYPIYKFWP